MNSNPFLILQPDARRTRQVDRAAHMTLSAVQFGQRALAGQLGPILAGDQRMDDVQFSRMFAATRLPAHGRDRLVKRAPPFTEPYATARRRGRSGRDGVGIQWCGWFGWCGLGGVGG